MVDIRIRKNERCIIGLPACDYVFSSTRSCFIAYGFSTSGLERDILKRILQERGIEPVEAGGQKDPGTFVFCTKICSKIIVSQFCIVLVNSDKVRGREVANPNVYMEYGLILGHNKYVIPFQKDGQTLAFNVSPLDTIKYTHDNFQNLATQEIDRAIAATSQAQIVPSLDQIVSLFLLVKNATIVNVQNDPGDRALFLLGDPFGFNLLVKFDGLSYVFLGNFSAFPAYQIIWRVGKLLAVIEARIKAVPTRMQLGLATEQSSALLEFLTKNLEIWLIVNGDQEETAVKEWLTKRNPRFPCEIFTLPEVTKIVSQPPGA
jgi:hypothetical protein